MVRVGGDGVGVGHGGCVVWCGFGFVGCGVRLYGVLGVQKEREKLPVRELNPGHPRDRRVY